MTCVLSSLKKYGETKQKCGKCGSCFALIKVQLLEKPSFFTGLNHKIKRIFNINSVHFKSSGSRSLTLGPQFTVEDSSAKDLISMSLCIHIYLAVIMK